MNDEALLSVEALSVRYETPDGSVHALRDVSLSLRRGEVLGLVGETGCGKSTLGYAALGDLGEGASVAGGAVMYKGADLLSAGAGTLRALRGAEIAMVPQNPGEALSPSVRIGRQLTEVLEAHGGVDATEARERAVALLVQVHLSDPVAVLERYPHQLSGGQQQRVVLAMALLARPELLVLDEPTTGLDVTVEATVLDLLEEIREQFGVAMLMIAHNLGVIARICERVGVMYAGEVVELADADDIFHRPQHPYTRALLQSIPRVDRPSPKGALASIPGSVLSPLERPRGCSFVPRCGYATERCGAEPPALEERDARLVRCFHADRVRADDRVFSPAVLPEAVEVEPERRLVVRDLKAHYRAGRSLSRRNTAVVRAVDGVNLSVDAARIVAVVGESGCGKSTLASTIVGLRAASGGRIEFLGDDVTGPVAKRPRLVQRLLQMVFQDHASTLNPSSTVGRIVARPLRLFDIAPRRKTKAEVARLLDSVGFDTSLAARRPSQLSGGQRQRVAIARAFAGRPNLVICDEATSALDVSVQAAILNLLLALQQEHGTSLLFISHDLGVVRYLADEVAVMYLGHIVEIGPARNLFDGPNHPYTEALLSAVPVPDPRSAPRRIRLRGSVPSAASPPSGCPFHPRCPHKIGRVCETEQPPIRETQSKHRIWCHLPPDELPRQPESAVAPPSRFSSPRAVDA